jgi:glycerate kinase
MEGVDLVITGEGRMERQTTYWKAPMGVAHMAREVDIPVVAIVGGVGDGWQDVYRVGIEAVHPIVNRLDMDLESARAQAGALVADAAENLMRTLRVGKKAGG